MGVAVAVDGVWKEVVWADWYPPISVAGQRRFA